MCYRASMPLTLRRPWRAFALSLGLGLLAIAFLASALEPRPAYQAEHYSAGTQGDFASFYADKLRRSAQAGVSAGNEERLLRFAPRTPLSILYIHGFGASRADGEYVVERLAETLRANTYFLRLPGHGSRMQDLEHHEFDAYLRTVEEALRHVDELGERRIVIGTSLGGLLSTYLAASHPDQVAALVLFSPFYDFVGTGKLLNAPFGLRLASWIGGPIRNTDQPAELGARVHADYGKHWYTRELTSSLRVVRDLKRYVARPEVFARVRCPVLLFYDQHDDVASAEQMRAAFATFARHERSRELAVEYGNHILASAYLETDKALILRESLQFLQMLSGD
jgi:pimeloyl-ACP methyl ester carboxylesterase